MIARQTLNIYIQFEKSTAFTRVFASTLKTAFFRIYHQPLGPAVIKTGSRLH